MEEEFVVVFHHGGNFVNMETLEYLGEQSSWSFDPDKWSYWEILDVIKEAGYAEIMSMWYCKPVATMGDQLVLLKDDKGAMEMVGIARVYGQVHLYVLHPISKPDVVCPPPTEEENVVPDDDVLSDKVNDNDVEVIELSDEGVDDIKFDDSEDDINDDFFGSTEKGGCSKMAKKRKKADMCKEKLSETDVNEPVAAGTGGIEVNEPATDVNEPAAAGTGGIDVNEPAAAAGTGGIEVNVAQKSAKKNGTKSKKKKGTPSKKRGRPKKVNTTLSAQQTVAESEHENEELDSNDEVFVGKSSIVKDRGLSDCDYNSSELESGCDTSEDENDDYQRSKYPLFKMPKSMEDYKWEIGTYFATKHDFKEAIKTYAIHSGRGQNVFRII